MRNKFFKTVLVVTIALLLLTFSSCGTVATEPELPTLECERAHVDDIMQLWGENDCVPDKKTALKIANIIVETQGEFYGKGFSEDREYGAEITFNEEKNEWRIEYYLTELYVFGGGIAVTIRKDNGMVTGMGFYA